MKICLSRFLDTKKFSNFDSSTITLSLTSFLAQLIVFLGTPLITRLYSPDNFADLSILTALIQFFGVFSSLRFENAIPLADSDEEADVLFIFCVLFNLVFSVFLLLVILALKLAGLQLFNLRNHDFMYFVPIGVSLCGFANLLSFSSIRVKLYHKLGFSRVLQSLTSIGFQFGAGHAGLFTIGPIIGYLFLIGFGAVYMSNIIWGKVVLIFQKKFTVQYFKAVLDKYARFPQYSLLEAVMQMFSIQLPFFYLNIINDQSESGFLLHSMKFSQIPILLVGNSISQVYYGSIKMNLNDGTLKNTAADVVLKLYNTIVLPLLIFIPISPLIFEKYLGVDWRHSGELLQYIIPYTICSTIFAVFNVNFYAKGKFGRSLKIQFTIFLIRAAALLTGHLFFKNSPLEVYFLASAFVYLFFSIDALNIINLNWKLILKKCYKQKSYTIAGCFFGLLLYITF